MKRSGLKNQRRNMSYAAYMTYSSSMLKGLISSILLTGILLLTPKHAYPFDYLKFALGVGSGYVIHEAAHQVVAEVNGTPFKWQKGFGSTWVTSTNTSDSERVELASAGLGSQVLSTEVILNIKDIPKDDEYVIGILTFNVLNAILYVISDGIINPNDNYGDIEMMDKAGLDREYVNTFLIVHSLFTIYRAYYKTDIPVYMTMSKNEIKVGVTILKW
ncbi:MAG: hypothetical protein HZA06_03885 [Nitrospirae bacterium]|nr:hypothetical protein [Nitrospirota bacterium]